MMEQKATNRYGAAKVISNLLHPYLVIALAITMVAYKACLSSGAWIRWTVVALLLVYLFPLSYMQAKAAVVARKTGARVKFRDFFREQPNEMLLLACLLGIPSTLILYLLGSPSDIIVVIIGVAVTSVVVALTNRVYRASFHLAVLTSLSFPLVVIAGLSPLTVAPFILLLGLSRCYLGEHTPPQLLAGFFIGLLVTGGIFYSFGFFTLSH